MASDEGRPTGVVGLGNLGRAVALNLLRTGQPVVAVDRSADRQQYVVERGAVAGDAEALAGCDRIVFVVPDEVGVREVLDAEVAADQPPGQPRDDGDGATLLSQLDERHAIVVLSTILPTAAAELAAAITDRGARYLDAPVTGGAARAEKGELTLLLGGRADDVQALQPLLTTIGNEQHLLGPIGAGSAAKLANQLIMFSALGGIHEALQLSRAHGVEDDQLLTALSSGTADTWVGRHWGFFDAVAADYDDASVPLEQRPWVKDLHEVLAAAEEIDIPMPLARVLSQTVADQIERHQRGVRDKGNR